MFTREIHAGKIALTTAIVTVILAAAPAWAQQADSSTPTVGAQGANSMPGVNDLLKLAEKATAPALSEDGQPGQPGWSAPVKLAIVFAILALLPSLLVLMTSFTRIIIVLSFVRRALSTQSIPPNVALVGLALFLTIFTMSPTFGRINAEAIQPYLNDQGTFPEIVSKSNDILKEFMLAQTRPEDVALFVELAGIASPATAADVPTYVAIPSFAISEFRTAFEMGFRLFVPFLLIDLVIAGILLSAGMMMLPPVIISLPFKIILFVLVDGWQLLARSLVMSFA